MTSGQSYPNFGSTLKFDIRYVPRPAPPRCLHGRCPRPILHIRLVTGTYICITSLLSILYANIIRCYFPFQVSRIMSGLDGGVGYPAKHNEKQGCRHKHASPQPILDHPRVTFPAHNPHGKLTQRTGVDIQENARRPPKRGPKHVTTKPNPRYTIEIIQQTGRKKWMQLTEQNNFPALTFNSRSQRAQRWVARKLLLKP